MNDETMFGSSTDDWLQFYEQSIAEETAFFDIPVVATTNTITTITGTDQNLSPTNSGHSGGSGGGGGGLATTPKGSISKPIRRRSRASKKTPITLLNANTNNFRALVQQFTGSQSGTLSFGARKGPINLNFATGGKQHGVRHDSTTIDPYRYDVGFGKTQSVSEQYNHNNQNNTQYQENQFVDKTDHAFSSSIGPNIQNTSVEDFFLESTSLYELIGDA